MSFTATDRPRETPQAVLEQGNSGRRLACELYVDRVVSHTSDLLGSRVFTLPLDTLSPHVVIRHRGPSSMLLIGALAASIVAHFRGLIDGGLLSALPAE